MLHKTLNNWPSSHNFPIQNTPPTKCVFGIDFCYLSTLPLTLKKEERPIKTIISPFSSQNAFYQSNPSISYLFLYIYEGRMPGFQTIILWKKIGRNPFFSDIVGHPISYILNCSFWLIDQLRWIFWGIQYTTETWPFILSSSNQDW